MSSPSFDPEQVWQLDPRDPAVLGDGRNGLAFVESGTWAFPYPGTVAGMVRATLLKDEFVVTQHAARAMLEQVRIRGPWLVEPATPESQELNPSGLRVPAPADVRLITREQRLIGATIEDSGIGEGALWPTGPRRADKEDSLDLPGLCMLEERHDFEDGSRAQKLDLLVDQHWPFTLAVLWNLGMRPETAPPGTFQKLADQAAADARDRRHFLHREQRMHVVIEDDRGTAQAGLLFSSGGLRLGEGWKLALEVSGPPLTPAPTGNNLTLLGGESRPSYLEVAKYKPKISGAFPTFDDHRKSYESCVASARGLRLQLLSPAYLPTGMYHAPGDPAWCPSWLNPSLAHRDPHPNIRELLQLEDLELRLHTVCIPGYAVVSGWNMRAGDRAPRGAKGSPTPRAEPSAHVKQRTGAPREVRRLVPSGSVYYLDLFRGEERLTEPETLARLLPLLCKQLWGTFIDPEGPGEQLEALREEFRAPAAYDGYGLILPGYWSDPPKSSPPPLRPGPTL
jgi:hypothetical protein